VNKDDLKGIKKHVILLQTNRMKSLS